MKKEQGLIINLIKHAYNINAKFIENLDDILLDDFMKNIINSNNILPINELLYKDNHILTLESKYHYYYTIYMYNDTYLYIGPYLNEAFSDKNYTTIIKENDFNYNNAIELKNYFWALPIINNISSINIFLCDLLDFFYDKNYIFTSDYIYYSSIIKPDIFINSLSNENFKIIEAGQTQELLLLDAIKQGNKKKAIEIINYLTNKQHEPRLKSSIDDLKAVLIGRNALFRVITFKSGVNANIVHNLSNQSVKEINEKTSESSLVAYFPILISKYVDLINSNKYKGKSSLIKKTIEYIDNNISLPISLNDIALEFNTNSSYLSNLFTKEINHTITSYIIDKKINISKELLTTSNLSISEICSMIGIYDSNYFTKQFKKNTGLTPSLYRKNNHILKK